MFLVMDHLYGFYFSLWSMSFSLVNIYSLSWHDFFSIALPLFFSLFLLVMITLWVMIIIVQCHCFSMVLLGHVLLVFRSWCGMKGNLLNFYLDDLMKWIKPFKGERDKRANGWCWSFSFLMAKSDFCLHCRFMVLKKWVMLHLCILICDDKWNSFLFVALDIL